MVFLPIMNDYDGFRVGSRRQGDLWHPVSQLNLYVSSTIIQCIAMEINENLSHKATCFRRSMLCDY